jgi:DNA-binding transcriptional MerR regulator
MDANSSLLRMREVCARTGLSRSTIHHYIREGILPKPAKSGRNTALYDEDFVRRARLVRTLQAKTHMPLAEIRRTLNGLSDAAVETVDVDRLADVTRSIADTLRVAAEKEISRSELLKRARLKPAELDGLGAAKLIDPIKRGSQTWYSPLDVQIVLALVRIREAGATIERGFSGSPQIIKAYRQHLTELARTEALEMVRMMRTLAEIDVDAFVAQAVEPLGDLVAAMHRKALVEAVSELTDGKKG